MPASALARARGSSHGETGIIGGRRRLHERSEEIETVLHPHDRPEAAGGTEEVGVRRPGSDEGRGGREPEPLGAQPKWGQERYEADLKSIGGVAGIGVSTANLKGTVDALK